MNKQRRAWNLAEKFEALQLLKKEGISKACRQLGLSSTTLYNWQRAFEQNGELGLSSKQDQDKNPEFERLKRENRELKMLVAEKELIIRVQNELLKKSP
ncbi:transposase [Larkinella sp. GY13]|uniref:transposase n=1 Tax=Larkinella sp. GY13 TaxID=3453720 RepID=UPI003EECDA32